MRKQTILSFTVAVLLGLISAQVGLEGLPGYAIYQGQAAINDQFASQYGINTTQTAQLNGGFGLPGSIGGIGTIGGSKGLAKGGAVSLKAISATSVSPKAPNVKAVDPVLAAKMAQLQAEYELRQIAIEEQEDMLEIQSELQLINDLKALQAAHAAAQAQAQAVAPAPATPVIPVPVATTPVITAPTPVTPTAVSAPIPSAVIPSQPSLATPAPVQANTPAPVATPTASALPTTQDLVAREQQLLQELDILQVQAIKNKLTTTVTNYKTTLRNQVQEFNTIMHSAVVQLKCDATCVMTCSASALTIDAKAACLDTCKCYDTPAVIVPPTPVQAPTNPVVSPATPVEIPASPVPAPVAPVEAQTTPVAPVEAPTAPVPAPVAPVEAPATPVLPAASPVEAPATAVAAPVAPVDAPTTPVVAPATPVIADAVPTPATPGVADATPVAADAATPIIVNAEPTPEVAAQALFLSEANLVHSATGALSGPFIVALILVFVTLLAAAFLHLQEKGEFEKIGAKIWSLRKGKAEQNENEEYLLIK